MLPKKSSNTSNSTPSGATKKTASAHKVIAAAGLQALVIVFVTAGLLFWWREDTVKVHVGNASIQAAVADTEAERNKGLNDKVHITDNHGMLFVFDYDKKWSIWMKDMKVPIDIVWIDANKKVVAVKENVSPDTYPAHYEPPENARYVLEIASGVASKMNIEPGIKAQFDLPGATR